MKETVGTKIILELKEESEDDKVDQYLDEYTIKNLIRKYSADISFVGSLYTEKCPYDRLQTEDAYLKGYLEGIMDAQMQLPGCYLLEELLPDIIVDSFRDAMPQFYIPPENSRRNDRAVVAQYYLCPKISSAERISIMRSLGSRYPVCLYTGSGTTGLAAKSLDRRYIGIELNAEYCTLAGARIGGGNT